jgi:CubicO group peptidase (beta-lactamase class C family)
MQSAGGLISTAQDMARWLEFQINTGKLDGKQIVPQALIRRTREPFAAETTTQDPFKGKAYGLGWQMGTFQEQSVLWHFGGFPGYMAHVSFMPDQKIGVAVMVNDAIAGGLLMNLAATYAYDWWLQTQGIDQKYKDQVGALQTRMKQVAQRVLTQRAERAKRPWQLSLPADRYAGEYFNEEYGLISVKANGNVLDLKMGNLHCTATPFTEPDVIRVELVPMTGETVKFLIKNGVVEGLQSQEKVFVRR